MRSTKQATCVRWQGAHEAQGVSKSSLIAVASVGLLSWSLCRIRLDRASFGRSKSLHVMSASATRTEQPAPCPSKHSGSGQESWSTFEVQTAASKRNPAFLDKFKSWRSSASRFINFTETSVHRCFLCLCQGFLTDFSQC